MNGRNPRKKERKMRESRKKAGREGTIQTHWEGGCYCQLSFEAFPSTNGLIHLIPSGLSRFLGPVNLLLSKLTNTRQTEKWTQGVSAQ